MESNVQQKRDSFLIPTLKLSSGHDMPMVGLGTWGVTKSKCVGVLGQALACGYRSVDCAPLYGQELHIGCALKRFIADHHGYEELPERVKTKRERRRKTDEPPSIKVKRQDLFITSKLWNTHHRREDVITACKQTLADLGLEYLDLYLMHYPVAFKRDAKPPWRALGEFIREHEDPTVSIRETWEAMEELVALGLVRSIGVSNFTTPDIKELLACAQIPPCVNQVEIHPYLPQRELVDWCQRHAIQVTAYSSLGQGTKRSHLLDEAVVRNLAQRHGKSEAQILLRWATQRGIAVIPKSQTPERLASNLDLFSFGLSEEDMQAMSTLNCSRRFLPLWHKQQTKTADADADASTTS